MAAVRFRALLMLPKVRQANAGSNGQPRRSERNTLVLGFQRLGRPLLDCIMQATPPPRFA